MKQTNLLLILVLSIFVQEESLLWAANAAVPLEQTALSAVCYLAESYLIAGHEQLIFEMKYMRKHHGKKFVFSAIQVEGPASGKVIYHPVPFVTGHNVTTAADADGRIPGKEALLRAKKLQNRQGFWTEYSVKNPVTGEKEPRYMFCERTDDRMICGSFPGAGKLPTQTTLHSAGTCF